MIDYKLPRTIIHRLHPLTGIAQNNRPLSPGDECSEESCNFNMGLAGEEMGNGDRILLNEGRGIELPDLLF